MHMQRQGVLTRLVQHCSETSATATSRPIAMDSQNVMSNVSRAVHVQVPCQRNPFTPIEGVMELRGIDISFTPQSKRATHSTTCPSTSAMAATGDDGKNQFRRGALKISGIAYRPEALSQSHLRQSHRQPLPPQCFVHTMDA